MTRRQEFNSWLTPTAVETCSVPEVGSIAPSTPQLTLPGQDGRPAIVTFLRHCGCPFAEKNFVLMREAAEARPTIRWVAVSHSDEPSTERWVEAVGGAGRVELVVDADRTTYGKWGLGVSSLWHVLNPWSLAEALRLGREENMGVRPTESGSRWQTSGNFAVDSAGKVRCVQVAKAADEIGKFDQLRQSLE